MTAIDRPSFLDRQKEAALADLHERQAEHRRIADLVLGRNGSRSFVTEVIKLGGDYVVEVTARDGSSTWTTVVNDERGHLHHMRQEEAILHLIASRYDSNANSNTQAAFYAGRVLGLPTVD
jgi:ABC-type uncharacterized transport system permease subunit